MTTTVLISTASSEFANHWKKKLESIGGVSAKVTEPAELSSNVGPQCIVVLDAGWRDYVDSEDELLTAVAYSRASGAVPAVILPSDASGTASATLYGNVAPLLDDMCWGLVSRSKDDEKRLLASIARRLDSRRSQRFEYVTVSPTGNEVLAVYADGDAVLLPRPLGSEDDSTPIMSIELTSNDSDATVHLKSGKSITLHAMAPNPFNNRRLTPLPDRPGVRGDMQTEPPMDGVWLGQRLRQLRKAAGLTQEELSRRTGIHRPNIARVERGRHMPSLETVAKIAFGIGVSPTQVFQSE
jgi:DNA-binding XRE family transcriptional regulator